MFRLKYTSTYGSLSPRAFLNLANRCSGSGASAILFLAFCQINTRMVECGRQAGDALCEQEPHQHDSINPRKLPQVWPRCVSNTARWFSRWEIYLKKNSVRKGVVLLVHCCLRVFGVVYAALALLAGVPGCVLPTTKRTHIHHSFNVKE